MSRSIFCLAFIFCITIASKAQVSENSYAIKNVGTGKVLRIEDANPEDGTRIVAYSPVNWKCVTWDFKRQLDGAYQLINLYSGKTMQPGKDGHLLEEQPVSRGEKKQQYEFLKAGHDQFYIKLAGTDLYITAPSTESNSTQITLTQKTGSALQLWTLKEQHPTI